jgi:hypothetical protein
VNHSPLSTVPEAVENRGLPLPSFLPSTQADVHTLTRTRRHKRTATKDQAEGFAGCCSGHFFTLASQSLLCALPPCPAQQPAAVHDTTETRARLKSAHLLRPRRHYCAACKTGTAPPRSKLVPVLVPWTGAANLLGDSRSPPESAAAPRTEELRCAVRQWG